MAQYLYFSRDAKLFIEKNSTVWEVPILDGFSFAQATNSSEVTLQEMESSGGVSRRGRRAFNDSLAPAEWSFQTYIRPFSHDQTVTVASGGADDAANVHAVEEILWAMFVGEGTYTAPTDGTGSGTDTAIPGFTFGAAGADANPPTTGTDISFSGSNKATLGTAVFWFRLGTSATDYKWYKITGCVANEASVDFEIDGIATINWSGMGSEITEVAHVSAVPNTAGIDVSESITSTSNFIRNRLSQLQVIPDLTATGQSGLESSYSVTLTGGNVTLSNNVTFITPEELGVVNVPIGHVTGTRSINGSFTCYLTDDSSNTNSSTDFMSDLLSIKSVVTNKFQLIFDIGGVSTSTPRLKVDLAQCHIEIPTHSIADLISVETNFMALPETIDATDDAVLTYNA